MPFGGKWKVLCDVALWSKPTRKRLACHPQWQNIHPLNKRANVNFLFVEFVPAQYLYAHQLVGKHSRLHFSSDDLYACKIFHSILLFQNENIRKFQEISEFEKSFSTVTVSLFIFFKYFHYIALTKAFNKKILKQ